MRWTETLPFHGVSIWYIAFCQRRLKLLWSFGYGKVVGGDIVTLHTNITSINHKAKHQNKQNHISTGYHSQSRKSTTPTTPQPCPCEWKWLHVSLRLENYPRKSFASLARKMCLSCCHCPAGYNSTAPGKSGIEDSVVPNRMERRLLLRILSGSWARSAAQVQHRYRSRRIARGPQNLQVGSQVARVPSRNSRPSWDSISCENRKETQGNTHLPI